MVFYTRNYAFDFEVDVHNHDDGGDGSNTQGHTPEAVVDTMRRTYFETTDTLPQLDIDLSIAREVDTLWLKSNIGTGRIYYSSDEINWTLISEFSADSVYVLSFDAVTAQHFRIEAVALAEGETNCKIYELYLVKKLFETKNPAEVDGSIVTQGGSYYLATGHKTVYSVREKWNGKFQFAMLPKIERDSITELYLKRKLFSVAPFPTVEPEKFYQVRFSAPPSLSYQHNIKDVGFSGGVEMEECFLES